MPGHRNDSGHAEDERKGKEVPFLPKPVDIYATKKFHVFFL
jgi:hypothetical protein